MPQDHGRYSFICRKQGWGVGRLIFLSINILCLCLISGKSGKILYLFRTCFPEKIRLANIYFRDSCYVFVCHPKKPNPKSGLRLAVCCLLGFGHRAQKVKPTATHEKHTHTHTDTHKQLHQPASTGTSPPVVSAGSTRSCNSSCTVV